MLSYTVIQGIRAKFWNTTIRSSPGPVVSRPLRITPPSDIDSRPAMMFSNVLFPQPECPMTVTNSPFSILIVTSLKMQTRPSPLGLGKYLLT